MGKKYSSQTYVSLRVKELPEVTATDLKNSTADILDQVATQGAVAITKHDKPRAVLISMEAYESMTGANSHLIAELHEEYRGVLERMQEPEQKAAAERLFEATPEELGSAAVLGAKQKGINRE